MELVITVVVVALVFEYINGFHDTANSIATVVSTKVLSPRQAIVLAAFTNLIGALMGVAVAKTITSGLVDAAVVSTHTIICALLGGIVWNLLTWWFGLPSSSTHAMVGGLVGAAFASAHGSWSAIIWFKEKPRRWWACSSASS
jgi:PiT family inorganic phosphate transporter